MTPLRQRMLEDMRLHGLSESTRNTYVTCIAVVARFFGRSPVTFTDADLRLFFARLLTLGRTRKTITVYLCALKFLYTFTLGRELPAFKVIRPPKEFRLPVIFSREEVYEIIRHVDRDAHRMVCVLLYSCGLRVNEALRLRVTDIDSHRTMLCVRNAKGNKDRYVPLPARTLQMLRDYYRAHRPAKPWLFANPATGKPYSYRTVEAAFKRAREAAGVKKDASCHGLRHAYATHLFEAGVQLIVIQRLLGHRSSKTTAIYAHVTPVVERRAVECAEDLMGDWQL